MYRPRERQSISFPTGTRVKQSFADDCDINKILAKYKTTGVIDHVTNNGQYVDCPTGLDFHDAQNLIIAAQQTFDELPAHVRKEFGNNPAQFLSFVENPENVERMRELGLTDPPEVVPEPITPPHHPDRRGAPSPPSESE